MIQESNVTSEKLQEISGDFRKQFYRVSDVRKELIHLGKSDEIVVEILEGGEVKVVPFESGKTQGRSVEW